MKYSLGSCTIDTEAYEIRCGGEPVAVEPQVFDLLVLLLRNRSRLVTKDEIFQRIWNGRIVSDAALSSRVRSMREAIGDDGAAQTLIRTVRGRGFRFVGPVTENAGPSERASEPPGVVDLQSGETGGLRDADNGRRGRRFVGDVRDISEQENEQGTPAPKSAQVISATHAKPHQEVTFCRTADGATVAVATSGHGPPIVKAANWLNHIEFDWQSPVWSPLLGFLSSQRRLIRYDERGTGLSDWNASPISFEAFVQDLESVVDSLGLDRFALFGISQGAPISIAYATRHPERVSRLVLFGGYLQGWRKRGTPEQIAQRLAMLSLVQHGWGQDNPAFRQLFTSVFIPYATLEEMRWFNDLQRVSTSPDNAVRLMEVFGDIDIADLLARVAVPTLVLHSRDDALVPLEQGLKLARGIPNARFVTLESRNHLLVEHEPAWPSFMDEVGGFLSKDDCATSTRAASVRNRASDRASATRQPPRRGARRGRERRP
jgi:pimeloyl-ACP methyl ester carboxylesterase/DNA-binding winged helix-turn-helix (wHTH) protein